MLTSFQDFRKDFVVRLREFDQQRIKAIKEVNTAQTEDEKEKAINREKEIENKIKEIEETEETIAGKAIEEEAAIAEEAKKELENNLGNNIKSVIPKINEIINGNTKIDNILKTTTIFNSANNIYKNKENIKDLNDKLVKSIEKHIEIVNMIDNAKANIDTTKPELKEEEKEALEEIRKLIVPKIYHFERNVNNIKSNSVVPAIEIFCNRILKNKVEAILDKNKDKYIIQTITYLKNIINIRKCYNRNYIEYISDEIKKEIIDTTIDNIIKQAESNNTLTDEKKEQLKNKIQKNVNDYIKQINVTGEINKVKELKDFNENLSNNNNIKTYNEIYKKLLELKIFYDTYYPTDIDKEKANNRPISAPAIISTRMIKYAWGLGPSTGGGKSSKSKSSKKTRRGGKELTEEELADLLNTENIDKDVADVLEINKKFGIIRERIKDMSNNWESYKSTYPIKDFKDLQPKSLLDTLLDIDITFAFKKLDDTEVKKLENQINEMRGKDNTSSQTQTQISLSNELSEKKRLYEEEKAKQDSLKKIFNPTFSKLIPLLSKISTFKEDDIENYSKLANKLKGDYKEETATTEEETATAATTTQENKENKENFYTGDDILKAIEYINEISRKYYEIEGYSKEELESIYRTLSTDLNTIKDILKNEITEIRNEIKEIIKNMSSYGEKYGAANIQINQNVYRVLEDQNENTKILIVEELNSLERELLKELEIYYKNIKKNALASGIPEIQLSSSSDFSSSSSPYSSYSNEYNEDNQDKTEDDDYYDRDENRNRYFGGAGDTKDGEEENRGEDGGTKNSEEENRDDSQSASQESPKNNTNKESFRNIIKEEREVIDKLFEDGIENEMTRLQNIIDIFISNAKKLKDPSYLLSTQGKDSLFNKLFNKYLEDRQNADKGEYEAANDLSENIKANKILPREVLKIDFRDKTIFIFVTMFIRLISLSIVNLLIDRGTIKTLGATILGFLITYSVLFIIFVLIVNIDTYKLRIIFNYVNMHVNSSIIFTYPIISWLFGGAIYYIMLNVNEGENITASSDEDRLRMQYKLETLSMILWVFISIMIILF